MEYMQVTFERMKEMKDKGYIQDTFLSDSYADAQEALLTGTAAMYPQATWIYAELTKLAESEEELDNIGFFPSRLRMRRIPSPIRKRPQAS